jgi:hypothetical protein
MDRLKKIAAGMIAGVTVGLIVYALQPSRWEGSVLVQLGHIEGQPIEEATVVLERLKSKSFVRAVVEKSGRNDLADVLGIDGDGGLTAKLVRNSDALSISVIAPTRDLAQVSIDSAASTLFDRHRAILDSYLNDGQNGSPKGTTERLNSSTKGRHATRTTRTGEVTDETRLVEASSVSEAPIFRSLLRSLLLFGFVGLGLSFLWTSLKGNS